MTTIVKINCADRTGIVSRLSSLLSELGCNILESSQFFQPDTGTKREDGTGQFFMRLDCSTAGVKLADLQDSLDRFRDEFSANVLIASSQQIVPTILMVSKFDHCLQDILYRVQTETLPIKIVAAVSNHPDARATIERLGIPFHLWPVTKENKSEQEAKLDELVVRTGAELIVLARYMQILSDEFSSKYFGKIINIHHSFLPAFKGAKPYHKAWDRGVKHIGATAHYVTPDLDEGPIIEQGTERVNHACDPDELVSRGRDIESRVLSRAIKLHAEERVFVNGSRTVVFEQ
ncbi:formyltetrahydrofolate deformylase [Sneathiella marina]|uniref:Formyltetrahydrofolate deformylase n=1 Tax=Sneathiella marina TaxID=2950108 RepID=A0ABY4W9S4_9PROT|nr:formyltetrahydrofolate deformylase [Sneathiella marina]USG62515.1 formyltetrahydrofolate deformylase [Sneathiella marina]